MLCRIFLSVLIVDATVAVCTHSHFAAIMDLRYEGSKSCGTSTGKMVPSTCMFLAQLASLSELSSGNAMLPTA